MNVLNRELARAEQKSTESEAQENEATVAEAVIAQLRREKAALRQALYEMALEVAEARVEAAMQSLRALDIAPGEDEGDDE